MEYACVYFEKKYGAVCMCILNAGFVIRPAVFLSLFLSYLFKFRADM